MFGCTLRIVGSLTVLAVEHNTTGRTTMILLGVHVVPKKSDIIALTERPVRLNIRVLFA